MAGRQPEACSTVTVTVTVTTAAGGNLKPPLQNHLTLDTLLRAGRLNTAPDWSGPTSAATTSPAPRVRKERSTTTPIPLLHTMSITN